MKRGDPDFIRSVPGRGRLLERLLALQGEVFRERPGRCTSRVKLEDRAIFVKAHYGVGWPELIKNWVVGKRAIVDAVPEWRALRRLRAVGVGAPEPLALAVQGWNPARRRSAVAMQALDGLVSLETLCDQGRGRDAHWRRAAVAAVAQMVRRLHGAGINHRDLYLCHFLLDPALAAPRFDDMHLIDLHRAQCHKAVPPRWRLGDLAALYHSALDCGLQRRDVLRFLRVYLGADWRARLAADAPFWHAVRRRAAALYLKRLSKQAQLPL